MPSAITLIPTCALLFRHDIVHLNQIGIGHRRRPCRCERRACQLLRDFQYPQTLGINLQKGFIAKERHLAGVKAMRDESIKRRQPFMRKHVNRLVFLDETSVKTRLRRRHGRSKRGERLYGSAPFGKLQTQTLIAGLSVNDIVASYCRTVVNPRRD